MKLNHLDLQVSNVPFNVALFEHLFDLTCTSKRTSPSLAFLTDGAGFLLVLQRKQDLAESYPKDFHFGFLVDNPATVTRTRGLLRDAGLVVSDVIENARGTMIYWRHPDGFLVEVSCREGHCRCPDPSNAS